MCINGNNIFIIPHQAVRKIKTANHLSAVLSYFLCLMLIVIVSKRGVTSKKRSQLS